MSKKDQGGYILREISPDDSVSGLSLDDDEFLPLKIFLRKHAKRYHQTNAAKTYVIVANDSPKKIIGYVTLVCSQIDLNAVPEDVGEYRYHDFPAVKIARLAVDARHRDDDLGTKLVDWALAVSTGKIMPHIGCRFLIVDSKQKSIKFYEKLGFRLVDTDHNRQQENPVMFIDIGKLE